MFIFMIERPWPPQGLLVNFRERPAVGVEKSPWTQTVSVYVDEQRRFLVNGQPVLGDELKAKLEQELSKQMVWTVYLEADSGCLFMDVVHAMDTIQGLGAKFVWITPRTREEWNRKSIH
jgi:biopolymer transport protein ExbD